MGGNQQGQARTGNMLPTSGITPAPMPQSPNGSSPPGMDSYRTYFDMLMNDLYEKMRERAERERFKDELGYADTEQPFSF